ncbi:hypothetical protein PF005_g15273 [Phytophthora fragariae]|uniref:Uncharacterized protein n=1 Tax=Phytophthora fragariae TaxID=53985 RepID=A0A6A3K2X5_9STRA|nr:hypothetical protein PF011_g14445 [Phytophthora fragariae]KAE9131070.1 hypothetical protein PF006_g15618 [Phytophthora fragariae]KAE9200618.1 hypothetical protein PF005_g15273 [Phytophthora fragariae]KAE9212492.1 hypothetical protein PF004_g15616 [Phytophthora fragariae]KAE9229702.1 hypothetical protein PF002_g13236 [Phytophthora fragariae]
MTRTSPQIVVVCTLNSTIACLGGGLSGGPTLDIRFGAKDPSKNWHASCTRQQLCRNHFDSVCGHDDHKEEAYALMVHESWTTWST